MRDTSTPVTDNCVYFYINRAPINNAYIWANGPFYDENNPFLRQSEAEYRAIKNKYNEDGITSFLDDICALKYSGKVDGETMLRYIHQYSSKQKRKDAYKTYYNYKNNIKYKHLAHDEDGRPIMVDCSEYIAHIEKDNSICERPSIHTRNGSNDKSIEKYPQDN